MDPSMGLPAAEVAAEYVALLDSTANGSVVLAVKRRQMTAARPGRCALSSRSCRPAKSAACRGGGA